MTTVKDDNYFSLLGLPVSFEIDMEVLNTNYRQIQRKIHPDNFANTSEHERRISVQKAAQVNDAFQSLKKPLKRSIYMLSLHGINLTENSNSIDPGFLMEQIDLRERLAQVREQDEPLVVVDEISRDVKSRIKLITQQLATLFNNMDENKLLQAKDLVLKMQFLERLHEECLNMEEELSVHL